MPCITIKLKSQFVGRGSQLGDTTRLTPSSQPFARSIITVSRSNCYSARSNEANADYIPRLRRVLAPADHETATLKRRIPRLFLERDLAGAKLVLDDREAHYLGHVLRLRRGDALVAFNGRGHERHANVSTLHRRNAELELHEDIDALPESTLEIALVQALTKAEAMDLIVQKATELGVRTIVPVYTEFSIVRLDEERTQRRLEHWNRIARSACEQCGRHKPPRIELPELFAAGLARLPASSLRLVLDPGSSARLGDLARPAAGVSLVIGPEGGLAPSDLKQIDELGFRRIGLGPRVLRAETAVIAACAAAQSLWGDF